jgi:SH3-like domain-containing protein
VSRTLPQLCAFAALVLVLGASACRNHGGRSHEAAYVSAPQTFLRDRVATVYNKVATVKNGERLDVLERSTNRRFVHVRTAGGADGWVEQRSLVDEDVYQVFQKLARDNASAPVQAQSTTHTETNLHVAPGRDSEHLYQLPQGGKLSVLKRAFAPKAAPGAAPKPKPPTTSPAKETEKDKDKDKDKDKEKEKDAGVPESAASEAAAPAESESAKAGPKPILEDWLLVRDAQGRVGWVLARLVDFDIPLEIAQYSEGQRMAAFFVLTEVPDRGAKDRKPKKDRKGKHDQDDNDDQDDKDNQGLPRSVPEYLVLFTEPKDGQPFDFNQIRVFSWNGRHHRYETAYREHKLDGVLPASVGREDFGKEGTLPTFTLHVRDREGTVVARKYKLNGPIVRLVKP